MRKRKVNAVILSLLIAAAMTGSAFAADTVGESITPNTPAVQTIPAINGGEVQIFESTDPQATVPEQQTPDASVPEGMISPDGVTIPAIELQEPVSEGDQEACVQPGETATSETPIAGSGTAVSDEEPIVADPPAPGEEPMMVDPAAIVEEAVTEPAIVEAEEATLTITHRLIVGGEYCEEVKIIQDLLVGQQLDLTAYLAPVDWAECITQERIISLDQTENAVVLEYVVKSDADVNVTIEDDAAVVEKDDHGVIETEEHDSNDVAQ